MYLNVGFRRFVGKFVLIPVSEQHDYHSSLSIDVDQIRLVIGDVQIASRQRLLKLQSCTVYVVFVDELLALYVSGDGVPITCCGDEVKDRYLSKLP